MGSCREILFIALLIPVVLSYPRHSRSTCTQCPPGMRVLQACTPNSDTVCILCASGTYTDSPNNATSCQPCSGCPQSEYISSSCSHTSDTLCSPCSTSPLKETKYYLMSCDKQDAGSDHHDVMMGDDAAADPPEGGNNNEHGGEVPADDVKEAGDNNVDGAKDAGDVDKDDVPNNDEAGPGTGDEAAPETRDDTHTGHDTPDETAQDTPDETGQDTPGETAQDTPDKTAQDTPDETAQDTPDETAQDTPAETAHDTPDKTAHDTPDKTAHDTPDETAQDTPDKTAHDTPDKTAQDTPDETAQDTPAETAHDTPDKTAQDTPDETAQDTPAETAQDTPDEIAQDTPDETAHDTPDETEHDTPDETAHDTPDKTDNVAGDETAVETGSETPHDATEGRADEKADEPILDTKHATPDDAGDKAEDNAGDEVPNETGHELAGEGGDEAAHDTPDGAGDAEADESTQNTGGETASDVGGQTDGNPVDKTTNETEDGTAYDPEDNVDLNSPRVLEAEHKEFAGDHSEGVHGTNDTVLTETPDSQGENASDDHPAGSHSLDITAESSDTSSNANSEHDAETLGSIHEHSDNTTDVEGTEDVNHLTQTDKPEERTTDAPGDSALILHSLHAGIDQPPSDDSNKTVDALADADAGSDHEPALGSVLSEETTNATQEGEIGSQGETSTSSPQAGKIVDIGVISANESEKMETDEATTSEPHVVLESDPGDAPVVVVKDDGNDTTIPPELSTEEAHGHVGELTTAAATDDNSTADDSKLGSLIILGGAKDDTKDIDESGAEATTPGPGEISSPASGEEASTARTPEEGDVAHGAGDEDVEVVTIEVKATKRVPTLEELEAQLTEQESGSGDDYEIVNINGKDYTTKDYSSGVENRPLAEGNIGTSHEGGNDDDYEDNKKTAIIVGVTVGGVALFALGFFASRYYKKRRGHFKEMKKVNTGKDGEALEFEPLKGGGNNVYDDPEISTTNGIYRPRGKTSPSFPLKNQREEKADVANLYAVPEKSKRAPLLGVSPPTEELSQSPSAQEPLISGVEKLKYIDDSTDDEYVNTVRTSLLPSRSPASRLSNVVEETPPTSPSIIQQYRPNWSTNQSKSGGSSSHTNGSTPKHTHSSVSSQGSLTNDVMYALSNQMQVKPDNRNNGERLHRKKAPSDEDIEC